MNSLNFHKMQGAGNDFVVIDNRNLGLSKEEIVSLSPILCDRKFGIGADGVLILERPQIPDVDFTMVYRNADGSNAGMCGNGARCLAMFAAHHGFQNNVSFNVHETVYNAEIDKIERLVTVYFPDVELPVWIEINGEKLLQIYPGTEHVVCFVDQAILADEDDLVAKGRSIRYAEKVNPPGTNVNFLSITANKKTFLQTYERGVENLTLACGTGAIASSLSAHFFNGLEIGEFAHKISVKGGTLIVSFSYDEQSNKFHQVRLTGPAEFVYEGTFHL